MSSPVKTRHGVKDKVSTARPANGRPANGQCIKQKPPSQKTPQKTRHKTVFPTVKKELVKKENGVRPWLIVPLAVDAIEASPYQPRLSFDAEEMADLVASVRAKGVQQPIIVRTAKTDTEALQNGANSAMTALNGKTHDKAKISGAQNGTIKPNFVRYELIVGERRLRACKEAGRKTIPSIIRDDLSDAECAELALLENVQRSNLSVIEEARGYKRLMVQFRMKEERIAKKVGKSASTIKDAIKLLQLPEAVQTLIANKKLTATHGHQLLALAPFERVCTLVAQTAAREQITARALEAKPLPNITELKRLGLVAPLDFRTKFDWKNECGKCPHKAYVTSEYNACCLKPEEWNKKQEAALELAKQEAARVMEEARQQNGAPVEAQKLPPGSYRNLSLGSVPAGCTPSCPCRSQAADPHDPTMQYPICLNPNRLSELIREERQANEDARRTQYVALWQQAKEMLQNDVEAQDLKRIATLLALPICQAAFCRYVDAEQWQALARGVSTQIGVFLPWNDLLEDEEEHLELYRQIYGQLETQTPERLLLLASCLLLAYEANQVVRFGGETPGIDFVLGRKPAEQTSLEDHEEQPDEQSEETNFKEDHLEES